MKISLGKAELLDYIVRQVNTFFPDNQPVQAAELSKSFDLALQRTEFCFSKVNNRYFCDAEGVLFNHLHADQYAMFLYFFSNSLYRQDAAPAVCDKLFHLNRYLHGLDAFYQVELPDIFLFVHPLGTVLGRGKYANYFLVYQRCNIGSNKDIYPVLQEYVSLHPGASVLGSCLVEENCKISAGSLLLDRNLPKDSVYIGNPSNYKIKESKDRNPIWK